MRLTYSAFHLQLGLSGISLLEMEEHPCIPSSALGLERCILGTWVNGNNLDRRTEGNTDFKKGALVACGNASRVYLEYVCCWTVRKKNKRERNSV